jgi:hypothetical protein
VQGTFLSVAGSSLLVPELLARLHGLLGAIMPTVRADEWDQNTVFTFSAPVEIPGQGLLAGTTRLELADWSSHRKVVSRLTSGKNANTTRAVQPTAKPEPQQRSGGAVIGSFTISHLGRLLGHRDTFSHPLYPVREDHAITLTKVSSCVPSRGSNSSFRCDAPCPVERSESAARQREF